MALHVVTNAGLTPANDYGILQATAAEFPLQPAKYQESSEKQPMIHVAKSQSQPAEPASAQKLVDLNDEQVMHRVSNGDSTALELLYDRYASAVMGLASKMLNDRNVAEEVVQETFWRVWNNADTFKSKSGKFSSWLFGITRNLCIDTWRRTKSRPQVLIGQEQEQQISNQPDPNSNVAESVWTLIKHTHVKRAIEVLPADQRQVIELAYFWGMTRQEISESLDVPLGTVHTRARLALKKLRAALKHQGLED